MIDKQRRQSVNRRPSVTHSIESLNSLSSEDVCLPIQQFVKQKGIDFDEIESFIRDEMVERGFPMENLGNFSAREKYTPKTREEYTPKEYVSPKEVNKEYTPKEVNGSKVKGSVNAVKEGTEKVKGSVQEMVKGTVYGENAGSVGMYKGGVAVNDGKGGVYNEKAEGSLGGLSGKASTGLSGKASTGLNNVSGGGLNSGKTFTGLNSVSGAKSDLAGFGPGVSKTAHLPVSKADGVSTAAGVSKPADMPVFRAANLPVSKAAGNISNLGINPNTIGTAGVSRPANLVRNSGNNATSSIRSSGGATEAVRNEVSSVPGFGAVAGGNTNEISPVTSSPGANSVVSPTATVNSSPSAVLGVDGFLPGGDESEFNPSFTTGNENSAFTTLGEKSGFNPVFNSSGPLETSPLVFSTDSEEFQEEKILKSPLNELKLGKNTLEKIYKSSTIYPTSNEKNLKSSEISECYITDDSSLTEKSELDKPKKSVKTTRPRLNLRLGIKLKRNPSLNVFNIKKMLSKTLTNTKSNTNTSLSGYPLDSVSSNSTEVKFSRIKDSVPDRFSFFNSENEETIHSPDFPGLLSPGSSVQDLFIGDGTWWLDCTCPTDSEMRMLAKAFGIHPLTAEDIRMQETREKVELFRNYYFVCFHTFEQDNESEDYLEPINVYIVVFRDGILSFHFSPVNHPANVRRRVRQLRDYVDVSADWLCYALIDDITDGFAPVITGIEYEADMIEDSVFVVRETDFAMILKKIGQARRKVMTLMRLLSGKADVIKMFAKRCQDEASGIQLPHQQPPQAPIQPQGPINPNLNFSNQAYMPIANPLNYLQFHHVQQPRADIALYLGDIQDHVVTMFQNLLAYEKIFSRSHGNYLAQLQVESFNSNNKLTQMFSKVTLIGTILIPLNVVTGLFGMNVHVPGEGGSTLSWFFGIVGVMIVLVTSFLYLAHLWLKKVNTQEPVTESSRSIKSFRFRQKTAKSIISFPNKYD